MGLLENLTLVILISLAEAVFFPIPPDVLLVYYGLSDPSNWFVYAFATTISSVVGGFIGYNVGAFFHDRVRNLIGDKFERVKEVYAKYGDFAIFLSGFSPIPYKIFTLSSGLLRYDLKSFLFYSFISRGLRFFAVSFLSSAFGKEVVDFFITNPIGALITVIVGIVLAILLKLIFKPKNKP